MVNSLYDKIVAFIIQNKIATGTLLLVLGILLNEKTLGLLLDFDGSIEYSRYTRFYIWGFNIFCVVQGLSFVIPNSLIDVLQQKRKLTTIILLVICFAIVIAFPLARGTNSLYYQTSDQDLLCIFNALYFTSGMNLDTTVAGGYIHTLLLGSWIKINYWFSLVSISNIDQFFEYSSEYGFGAAITPLIISGRYFSMILGFDKLTEIVK